MIYVSYPVHVKLVNIQHCPPVRLKNHGSSDLNVLALGNSFLYFDRVSLSALVACGGVHHHLVQQKKQAKVALVVETGEAREVHHLCVLVAYGADAVCPYLFLETIHKVVREGL